MFFNLRDREKTLDTFGTLLKLMKTLQPIHEKRNIRKSSKKGSMQRLTILYEDIESIEVILTDYKIKTSDPFAPKMPNDDTLARFMLQDFESFVTASSRS